MKKLVSIFTAILALASLACAQTQTFHSVVVFDNDVYLADDLSNTLADRIPSNAAVSAWSLYAASTNVDAGGFNITNANRVVGTGGKYIDYQTGRISGFTGFLADTGGVYYGTVMLMPTNPTYASIGASIADTNGNYASLAKLRLPPFDPGYDSGEFQYLVFYNARLNRSLFVHPSTNYDGLVFTINDGSGTTIKTNQTGDAFASYLSQSAFNSWAASALRGSFSNAPPAKTDVMSFGAVVISPTNITVGLGSTNKFLIGGVLNP